MVTAHIELNKEQLQAIACNEGAWNCLACAGSGKTEVLVRRAQRLLKEGASPDDLLLVTFTREAASNIATRLDVKFTKDMRGGPRTFHSFCLNLIRKESRFLPYGLSANPFPEGPALYKLLLEAMKKNGLRRKNYEKAKAFISRNKRQRITPEQACEDPLTDHLFARTYSTYESMLREGGMLDFDSMMAEAVNILEKHAEVRDRFQFKWVLVDEAQDTDDLQFRLLQLVSEKYKNIFVVGDYCQALYEFRGANPENLVQFVNWFPGARTIILPENFRSTAEIVEYSKKNAPIDNELTRNIRTGNPRSGIPIEFRIYAGPAEEAEATLSAASADPGHSAVLARTNNQLGLFETLALQHNVKFHRLGKSGFWNQPEVSMLVNLAAFCMGTKAAVKYSETLLEPYRRSVRVAPPEAALARIINFAKLENLYSNEDFSDDENFAINNLYTVAGIAKRFRTLQEFLNHARKAAHASRKTKNAVTLATIHAAKGLEWDNVFVVGMECGKLPHEKGTLAEEKRIWYVARTRPRKRLRVSFAGTPSEFLADDLTPEIQTELRKHAATVETIKKQQELFGD